MIASQSFLRPVRPELIDWRCDQGKHDNSLTLTGILTLRGVIGASMFDNRSIASVDDRSNRKHSQKWLNSLTQWVNPDNDIAGSLAKVNVYNIGLRLHVLQKQMTMMKTSSHSCFLIAPLQPVS